MVVPKLSPALSQQITALLFADAVGFSRLAEEEIPYFVHQFLGKIAVLLATTPHAPVLRATWGDGLYFVFESVESAGSFALDLNELVANTDWSKLGLPSQLGLRIALHAGPTYRCVDPVSGQANYTGTHVSRAARIEPITPPNQVYASQSFVALAAADSVEGFEWDYVGVIPLAKNYGTAPMYHLRRSSKGPA
jgi:class 3 adenylate cyclase